MRGTLEVHQFLLERQVPHEFYRLERPLRRIDEAAELLGLDPSQVVAAELFEARPTPILALTPATACASMEAVAQAAGCARVRAAKAGRVAEHTGFLPDWLPPVGFERPATAVLDASLLDHEVVYAAGGDPGVVLVLRSADLVRATAAAIAPLTVPAEQTPEVPAAGARR
jgi:prolyl-tRNA editing enzyme YbaK/EbsC (Cys-tRNA(Pro) deacylase)